MIPADYQPPKTEIVYEHTVEMPKREYFTIYPSRPREHENYKAVNLVVYDDHSDIWIYDVLIFFEKNADYVIDLKVPRHELFSLHPTFDWQEEYLQETVKILLALRWEEVVEAYSREQKLLLEELLEKMKPIRALT